MAIVLNGISVPLSGKEQEIKEAAAKKLGINESAVKTIRVKKQSLDCRKKDIRQVYTLHVALFDGKLEKSLESKYGTAENYSEPEIIYGMKDAGRPIVIGAGPCGLFAALTLARHGYKPLLLERGCSMEEREKDVKKLLTEGILNGESNVCFGAGGAGAFSDGKLMTRIKDGRAEYVLETLIKHGAPQELLSSAKPHAGTENIRAAVVGIIDEIKSLGGEVVYNARLGDITVAREGLSGIIYNIKGREVREETRALILAIGHSARDTYEMLVRKGVALEPKPFAIGLRIEHKREFIDRAQYGDAFSNPALGAAEYRLTSRSGNRGVYTFCMCPGGEVICSSTEDKGVAVNGMSYYARSAENSNSAIVASVTPEDFPPGALGGVEFQRIYERAAYSQGFGAPVQTLGDFLNNRVSRNFGSIQPSYKPHTEYRDLNGCLPKVVSDALKEGIKDFGTKLKGFDMPDAVLTGVETRTSAPVRILRNNDFQAAGIEGLFPAGEGAGYAGGIVSSAVDGIKCAEALMGIYRKP